MGYSPTGSKASDTTKQLSMCARTHTHTHTHTSTVSQEVMHSRVFKSSKQGPVPVKVLCWA